MKPGIRKAVVIVVLSSASIYAHAGELKKPGFSIVLPPGWIEIPKEVLTTTHDELVRKTPNAKIPKYDYGFQLKTALTWMEYPYILIQVGSGGRPPEYQLKALPKIDLSTKTNEHANNFRLIMSNIQLGQMQYDEKARIAWMSNQADVTSIGAVQSLSGIIPTEKGLLMIHGYSRQTNYQQYADIFREIIASTTVAPELAYRPQWMDNSQVINGINWGQIGTKAIGGAFFAGLFAAFIGLWHRRKKQ